MENQELALLTDVYDRASRAGTVSLRETQDLVAAGEDVLDYADLLPLTLPLDGKPMDVLIKRPMFAPLFRRKRKAKREIYLCGRQLGKTSSAAASMLMNLIFRERFRVLYVAPLQEYANGLHHFYQNPMQQGCMLPWPIVDKSCIANVNEKTYANGSHLNSVSCFNSPRRALGKPKDSVFYDETQDLNYDFIPQIRETLGSSKFKWESFFGTARGLDNTIEELFDQSCRYEWHMRCRWCGYDNVPIGEDALRMIQPAGLGCAKCSTNALHRPLQVNDGIWIPTYGSRVGIFDGYHVPQTIVADRVEDRDNYLEIYHKLHGVEAYSAARFQQEVLGISSESGGRPVSPEQLRKASILDITDSTKLPAHEYAKITAGVDWGGDGASATSFTICALVGFHTITRKFHCLGAYRPVGYTQQDQHYPVARYIHSRIPKGELDLVGADGLFLGAVQNPRLGAECGVPCASILYGSGKRLYKGQENNFFSLDKSTMIFIVYSLIISGQLLFPKGEEFERFSRDLMATKTEDVTNNSTGAIHRRYARIPSKPDDFLHALAYGIFCCALGMIDLTTMVGLTAGQSINQATSVAIGND